MKTLKFLPVIILAMAFTNCDNKETTAADMLRADAAKANKNMYVIEREIPGAGDLTAEELKGISQISCGVLKEMGSDVEWLHSYVTGDKIYCVYMASSEELVREHAEKGGFPANSVAAVGTIIDPTTAGDE